MEAVGSSAVREQSSFVQMELRCDSGLELEVPSAKTQSLTRSRGKFKETLADQAKQMHLLEGATGTMKKTMKAYIPKNLTNRFGVSWA